LPRAFRRTWPLPAPAASQQLFLWFFAVILIAFAVPVLACSVGAATALGWSPVNRSLMVAGLFGLGILPQALQRPDSTHLAWVAVVSWSLLVPTIATWLARTGWPQAKRALAGTVAVGLGEPGDDLPALRRWRWRQSGRRARSLSAARESGRLTR
jgi:hypothetical protein